MQNTWRNLSQNEGKGTDIRDRKVSRLLRFLTQYSLFLESDDIESKDD